MPLHKLINDPLETVIVARMSIGMSRWQILSFENILQPRHNLMTMQQSLIDDGISQIPDPKRVSSSLS